MISGVVWESKFWHLRTKSALISSKWLIQKHKIPHFKAFGMSNFKYEVKICQKICIKGTIIQNSYYLFRWLRLYYVSIRTYVQEFLISVAQPPPSVSKHKGELKVSKDYHVSDPFPPTCHYVKHGWSLIEFSVRLCFKN